MELVEVAHDVGPELRRGVRVDGEVLLLLLGATGREQIDGLNKRTLASASGFRVAYRELLKRQTQE